MIEERTRPPAFGLVAEGVSAGLPAPSRIYLARGCRYLSVFVCDRVEWDSWRAHLDCPDLTVRIYELDGNVRRSSVARAVRDGCRISVELVEHVPLDGAGRLWPVEVPL